jgi:DNA-binding NtrC family response regulator
VLEDDASVRRAWEGMARALRTVLVRTVATAAEARACLAAEAFDLVLCDLHLAGGETSVALVRELAGARAPIVAILSGEPNAAIAELGLKVPVFSKPVRLGEVLKELGLASE